MPMATSSVSPTTRPSSRPCGASSNPFFNHIGPVPRVEPGQCAATGTLSLYVRLGPSTWHSWTNRDRAP
jgi:hypothetical protein